MPVAQLIICEKSGKWAAALRRELGPQHAHRLFESRLIQHCQEQLAASPCSIAALEQTWKNYDSVLLLIDRIQRQFPSARSIVLDTTGDSQLSRMTKIAGAIHIARSRLMLRHAARLALRHFARFPETSSQFEELVRRLPWKPATS